MCYARWRELPVTALQVYAMGFGVAALWTRSYLDGLQLPSSGAASLALLLLPVSGAPTMAGLWGIPLRIGCARARPLPPECAAMHAWSGARAVCR